MRKTEYSSKIDRRLITAAIRLLAALLRIFDDHGWPFW